MKKQEAFISIFAIFMSAMVISILTGLYILLVNQIEIMNQDSASFQALYMADTAFECGVYKLQEATGTKSYFLPNNYNGFGNCGNASDTIWVAPPQTSNARASSILNVGMSTSQGNFCAVVTTGVETGNSKVSNLMDVSGQSRGCTDASTTRVVERIIDFYF
jgi:hypothetical protein